MNNKKNIIITVGILVLLIILPIIFYPKNTEREEIITPVEESQCIVAGCNGELCIDKDSELGASSCMYREEYKCFQYATCEEQEDGTCGWTNTEEFDTCRDSFLLDIDTIDTLETIEAK